MNRKLRIGRTTTKIEELYDKWGTGRKLLSRRVLYRKIETIELDWLDWIVRTLLAYGCGLLWGLNVWLNLTIALLLGLVFSLHYFKEETPQE